MVCASAEEVERILSLSRWKFPGHSIRADRWLESAGTSELVASRGFRWIMVSGIPVHLRSEAVLQEIAGLWREPRIFNVEGCNLNEVKVKIRDSSLISDSIGSLFESRCFNLR
ncbi:hypothetical protein LINGRAHAP2_LOCUS29479 [Linum grandiflorum]